MSLCTCNLPNLQTVCAQRFTNTVAKIVLHLDLQNIWVTSEDMGEGHKPSRNKGTILKANPLQSPDGGSEKLCREMGPDWYWGGLWFRVPLGAALLKQLQRNESLTSKGETREAALWIFQEIYFLLFALIYNSLLLGSKTWLPQEKKKVCSLYVLA